MISEVLGWQLGMCILNPLTCIVCITTQPIRIGYRTRFGHCKTLGKIVCHHLFWTFHLFYIGRMFPSEGNKPQQCWNERSTEASCNSPNTFAFFLFPMFSWCFSVYVAVFTAELLRKNWSWHVRGYTRNWVTGEPRNMEAVRDLLQENDWTWRCMNENMESRKIMPVDELRTSRRARLCEFLVVPCNFVWRGWFSIYILLQLTKQRNPHKYLSDSQIWRR